MCVAPTKWGPRNGCNYRSGHGWKDWTATKWSTKKTCYPFWADFCRWTSHVLANMRWCTQTLLFFFHFVAIQARARVLCQWNGCAQGLPYISCNILYIWFRPATPPPQRHGHGPVCTVYAVCTLLYAVCRKLYVRYSLHPLPMPLWDGWGLGSVM